MTTAGPFVAKTQCDHTKAPAEKAERKTLQERPREVSKDGFRCFAARLSHRWVLVVCLLLTGSAAGEDWTSSVRVCAMHKDFACAQRIVEYQLRLHPSDPEAATWKARLLAWQGQWDDAIAAYETALKLAPEDGDILLGLADVQIWKHDYSGALPTLDRAAAAHAPPAEVLPRKAAALAGLGRTHDAEQAFEDVLRVNPGDAISRQRLRDLRSRMGARHHELRIGSDADTFSFAGPANSEALSLRSDWSRRWTTRFATIMYQRFGETAETGSGEVTLHLSSRNWLTAGVGLANHQQIVPEYDNAVEYGHSSSLRAGPLRGIESYVQQRNYWYDAAQVSTFGSTQVIYLPDGWLFTVNVTAARADLYGSGGAEWTPSGFTRLNFPLGRALQGNVLYGVGTEDFLVSDQIGHFSARTYGGGVRIRLNSVQDLAFQFAFQDRSRAQSQISAGASYGIHF